jgi:hypothetical protein
MTVPEYSNAASNKRDTSMNVPAAHDHPGVVVVDPSSQHATMPTRLSSSGQQQQPSVFHQTRPTKAQKHRKRHVPVGPAGIWFQKQQQHPSASSDRRMNHDDGDEDDDDEEKISHSSDIRNRRRREAFCVYSPAWTAAQCELQITTPMTFPVEWSVSQKSAILRRCLPDSFALISEILAGDYDWRLENKQLLCQITSIQDHIFNDYLWTVMLQDETGAEIAAWMQPSLVESQQQQQQQSNSSKSSHSTTIETCKTSTTNSPVIKVGYVWLISGAAIQLVAAASSFKNHDAGLVPTMDRMLLISQNNIRNVWSPASADQIPNDLYIAWMERRNSLSSELLINDDSLRLGINEDIEINETDDDHEEEEEEVEEEEDIEYKEQERSKPTKLAQIGSAPLAVPPKISEMVDVSQPAVSRIQTSSVSSHSDKLATDQLTTNSGNPDTILPQIATIPSIQPLLESKSPTLSPTQRSLHRKSPGEATRHRQPYLTAPSAVSAELSQPPSAASPPCNQTPQYPPVVSEENVTPPLRDISQNNDRELYSNRGKRESTGKGLPSALWTSSNNKLLDILGDNSEDDDSNDEADVRNDPREENGNLTSKKFTSEVQPALFTSQSKDMATEPVFHDDRSTAKKSPPGSLFHSSTLAGFDPDDFSEDEQ